MILAHSAQTSEMWGICSNKCFSWSPGWSRLSTGGQKAGTHHHGCSMRRRLTVGRIC